MQTTTSMNQNLSADMRSKVAANPATVGSEPVNLMYTEKEASDVNPELIRELSINKAQKIKLDKRALPEDLVPSEPNSQTGGDVTQRVDLLITEPTLTVAFPKSVRGVPSM